MDYLVQLKMRCHSNIVVCTIDMTAMQEQMDADQEEMLAKMEGHQERMEAIMDAR
jgi:hypothetical protein